MAGTLAYVRSTGLRARATPGRVEIALAREMRRWAVPVADRNRTNPVARTPAVEREGLEHFADHCATCHANDGSGNTEMGRGLFPPAPDMRLAATQQMTDGELFYVIEHGIRFTGMPGWSTGTAAGEESSWHLVHFVRKLPHLSKAEGDEMTILNPRSPAEVRQARRDRDRQRRGSADCGRNPDRRGIGCVRTCSVRACCARACCTRTEGSSQVKGLVVAMAVVLGGSVASAHVTVWPQESR